MLITETYALLKRRGLVANHVAFSLDYLNKGPRYYDHLLCSRQTPAIAAMMSLFVRVSAIADALTASPALTMHAAEISELVSAIWEELKRSSCGVLPLSRVRPFPTRVIQGGRNGSHSQGAPMG